MSELRHNYVCADRGTEKVAKRLDLILRAFPPRRSGKRDCCEGLRVTFERLGKKRNASFRQIRATPILPLRPPQPQFFQYCQCDYLSNIIFAWKSQGKRWKKEKSLIDFLRHFSVNYLFSRHWLLILLSYSFRHKL